jgi:hypothetical protein
LMDCGLVDAYFVLRALYDPVAAGVPGGER